MKDVPWLANKIANQEARDLFAAQQIASEAVQNGMPALRLFNHFRGEGAIITTDALALANKFLKEAGRIMQ